MEFITIVGVILSIIGLFKVSDSNTTKGVLVSCMVVLLGVGILLLQYVLTGTIVGL